MTYITNMKTRPITVAETQIFARSAAKIWSEAELAELVVTLPIIPKRAM
jgi:hypothetical protein